jgi:hypothetical protein
MFNDESKPTGREMKMHFWVGSQESKVPEHVGRGPLVQATGMAEGETDRGRLSGQQGKYLLA